MKIFTITTLLFCLLGCNSKNESDESEKRILQLEKENKSLRENTNSVQENTPINQYAVIVLNVEALVDKTSEEMRNGGVLFDPYKKYKGRYVSGVLTENDSSEDNKYKLMDEFQAEFMRKSHNGVVHNRNILFYSTYGEASRSREELMK